MSFSFSMPPWVLSLCFLFSDKLEQNKPAIIAESSLGKLYNPCISAGPVQITRPDIAEQFADYRSFFDKVSIFFFNNITVAEH